MAAKLLFSVKERLFTLLIGRNPLIKREYQDFIQYRDSQSTFATIKGIVKWTIKYGMSSSTLQKRISKLPYPETSYINGWKKEFLQLQQRAWKADIISLDFFGVMILAPFSDTDGLFLLLGEKWGVPNFRNLRIQAEHEALDQKEVRGTELLVDIYSLLETWCAVPAEEGIRAEKELVKELCFANPEMKRMYDAFRAAGKKIIFVADTNLTSDDLAVILHRNGIVGYEKIFASCECNFKLKHCAEEYFGRDYNFFHIYCHKDNNRGVAGNAGSNLGCYPSLNNRGERYRPYGMHPELKSIYDGICNSWLHSGQKERSIFYEYGFTCGGILAVSVCQWLDRMAKQHGFELILFAARDGDIISKVYRKYFNHVSNDYILLSRMSLEQLVFHDFTEEYIDHVILPELKDARKWDTIASLFGHIGIADIKRYWEREGFSWDVPVHSMNDKEIRRFIYKYKPEICRIFDNAARGAKKYFLNVIGSNRNICLFDIGWRGTSAVYLKHLFEREYRLPVQVTGALLGGGADDYAAPFFMDDSLLAFAFSPYKNCEIMEEVCESQERILAMELLFSSETPSLLAFGMSPGGETLFHFERENPQDEVIREVHRGIMDFADRYFNALGSYAHRLRIHSLDAVSPVMTVLRNKKQLKRLTAHIKKHANARHGF